jgi:hypothetical protein
MNTFIAQHNKQICAEATVITSSKTLSITLLQNHQSNSGSAALALDSHCRSQFLHIPTSYPKLPFCLTVNIQTVCHIDSSSFPQDINQHMSLHEEMTFVTF